MSPIEGLSTVKRVPRLGKIRLGIKVTKKREDGTEYTYPAATDYFVCPPEVLKALGKTEGDKITELSVMFPIENDEIFAQQWYRRYSSSRGLVCKGDGRNCSRVVDTKTGALADRDAKDVVWREGLSCEGQKCPEYQAKNCKEVMNLQFVLPDVPGLGVWQIDTGSVNSIININSAIDFIRKVYHRISWIPLLLRLEKQQVINPDDGKKKMVHVLQLNTTGTMLQLATSASRTAAAFALPAPEAEEPPEDVGEIEEVPTHESKPVAQPSEKQRSPVVIDAQAEKDADSLFGGREGTPGETQKAQEVARQQSKATQPVPPLPPDLNEFSEVSGQAPEQTSKPKPGEFEVNTGIDMDWLKEHLKLAFGGDGAKFRKWVQDNYKVTISGTLAAVILRLSAEQKKMLVKEIQSRYEAAGGK